jgi:serine phosphatase RsbU (regulator of sigma subunit)
LVSETRIHIAGTLRKGLDDLARKWAGVISPYYESAKVPIEELAGRSKIALEVLANLLEGEDSSSYSNYYRKLAFEWISVGGTVDNLKELKKKFLKVCENRFTFVEIVDDKPEILIDELDKFLEKELWLNVVSEYLAVFESEVTDKLKDLPNWNESLKRLLNLTGRLGGIIDAGDIWEELLYEMREIFPSMDSGAVFLFVNGKLVLKGIAGFEDFVVLKNGDSLDFSLYKDLSRRLGIRITNSASLDSPEKMIFHRRRITDKGIERDYPASMLSFPLITDDTRKGLICIYGYKKKGFFAEDELALLEILFSNLRSAIVRSQTIANLRESRRDSEFLIGLQRRLSGIEDPESLGKTYQNSVLGHLGELRSVIYLKDPMAEQLVPLVSYNTLLDPGTNDLSALYTFAIERKAPIFLSSLKDNPVLEGILPPTELVTSDDDGALGIVPLIAGSDLIGIWGFALPDTPDLGEDRRLFLTLAANVLTFSLKDILALRQLKEEHEVRGREISLAASLQQDLVPRYYRGHGYEIEISLHPGGDLAGDFAFLEKANDEELLVAIGDVSGRGIAAGMSMMSTYGLLGELTKTSTSPGAVLERLNNRLREQFDKTLPPFLDETFVTCFLINASSDGMVRYAKAGHLPPLLLRATDDSLENLDAQGVPLGIFSDSVFNEGKVKMLPGDCLVMYTDGITEARNENEEDFGLQKLVELIRRWHKYPPRILQHMIGYQLQQFIPKGSSGDDRTWIVIGREMDGWMQFVLPSEESGRRGMISDIVDYIAESRIVRKPAGYGRVLSESARSASEGGHANQTIRILKTDESLHVVISDNDKTLRGLDYPGFSPQSKRTFPDSRKALNLIRSDVDFIWYNNNSRELNVFQAMKGSEVL